ncbi:MAG: hypothetical protein AAF558_04490 [Verrucomicrobiota bacterium]
MNRAPKRRPFPNRRKRQFLPIQMLQRFNWNVFEDFSAFQTYLNIAVIAYVVLIVWNIAFEGKFVESVSSAIVIGSVYVSLKLWCDQKVTGLPIFPISVFTCVYTFGLQFLIFDTFTDMKDRYFADSSDIFYSSIIVASYILSGTLVWYLFLRKPSPPPQKCYQIVSGSMDTLFLVCFVITSLFTAAIATEKFINLGRFYPVFRAITGTLSILSSFVLSYHIGQRSLPKFKSTIFLVFLVLQIVANCASLLLIGALTSGVVVVLGYTLGRHRLPWIALLICFPIFFILHQGKAEMREKYWHQERAVQSVQFLDYPKFFLEWFDFGIKNLNQSEEEKEQRADLLERTSLLQVLLTAQLMSPEIVPHLNGKSYNFLHLMLVPRFLNPNKFSSHESTTRLNIHYLIQTREMTLATTIGWGLLNEAYANFAIWGTILVGGIMGWLFALVTRLSSNVPILSFPGLLGILTISFAFQSEYTSSAFISSYFQACVALFLLRVALMKSLPNPFATQVVGRTKPTRSVMRRRAQP